jgi:urease accessory protein
MRPLALCLILAAAAAPELAAAHAQTGAAGGFASGFAHPFLGPEHLVAMVAVGVWGAQLGMPLLAALPIAFPLMMSVGALMGVTGLPLPLERYGVAFSAVALGAAVFFALRLPTWAAVAAVGVFAIYHGYAHGAALHPAENPLAYALGFVVATGALHLAGVGIGAAAVGRDWGPRATRACGAIVAAVGAAFAAAAALAGA